MVTFGMIAKWKTSTAGVERCQLDTCNTKKKQQSRVRIQFLAARATIISSETDEERTCLLGGGAGRSPIDRVIGGLRERVLIAQAWSMLFYFLTCEGVGFVAAEDVDLTVMDNLCTLYIVPLYIFEALLANR